MVSRQAERLVAGSPLIADAHFRAERAPYDPRHRPDGYVNLGTAENRLVWDLLEPRVAGTRPLSAADARYAPLHGTPELRAAVAALLSRGCRTPVRADDLVVVSGATAALDLAASALCDPGEVIVVPAPYYGAFEVDLTGRSGARLVAAPTGSADRFGLSPAAVGAAIERARDDGATVRAVAVASPSNPVGLVHPAALLGELAELARRHDVDLVSDEIYAGSVFGRVPFASLADPAVNPGHHERTHVVWGFAKDFGLPGFKVGVLHTPDPRVRAAARGLAYFAPTSTHTQALLTDLLGDPAWLAAFAVQSRRRLAASYAHCAALLAEHGIGHVQPQAGLSVWIDLRGWLPEPAFAAEQALWREIFETARVSILPGGAFASPEPGWFRLCHGTDPAIVAEGVVRIGRVLRSVGTRPARARTGAAGPRPATRAGPAGTDAAPARAAPAGGASGEPVGAAGEPVGAAGGGPLDAWYRAAGVRSGARRMLVEELDEGMEFFPRALVPYLAHEAVRRLPPRQQRELAIRHLYQFLLSTAHLETRIVNRGAERLANGRAGVQLSMPMRLDAFKVYCDEGYHALYSLDLADQVARVTGVAIPRWDYGGFVDQLERAGAAALPTEPVLAQLLQVTVFETLVTAVLNEVPSDPSVLTVIRDVTRDHARDEGRHHRFFAAFFHELWSGLDRPVRERVARALPPLVHGCLLWDVEPVRSSLVLAGLDAPTAAGVVADCYGGSAGRARIADVARATVRMCQSTGVLDVPGGYESFASHGLLRDRPDETGG